MNRKKHTTKHVQPTPLPIPRNVRLLLEELEYHSSSGAIITLIGESEQPYVIDLRKISGEYVYGHHPAHKAQFISKLLQPGMGALVLRSFRDEEQDPETGLPIKELRGYTLMMHGDELQR